MRTSSGGATTPSAAATWTRCEHGVGLHKVNAERGGRALEDNSTLVFHVRDGKVTEVWQYWGDPYAADELFA